MVSKKKVKKVKKKKFFFFTFLNWENQTWYGKLEELTVLKRSPDLLNTVKIGQDQLQIIMKIILFYGGCGHFGQVT